MKKIITVLVAAALATAISGCASNAPQLEHDGVAETLPTEIPTQSVKTSEPPIELDESDKFYSAVDAESVEVDDTDYGETLTASLTALGFTIDEATDMRGLFLQMGIDSLSSIQQGPGSGIDKLQSFVAIANGNQEQKFYFTVENRVMFYAGFMDEDLYDSENGGILNDINDIHIPATHVDIATYDTLRGLAEDAVNGQLNYPNTADFSMFSWGIGRSDSKYKIIGSVTAKNGFGVENEIPFAVWFVESDGNFSIEGIAMDGVRVK